VTGSTGVPDSSGGAVPRRSFTDLCRSEPAQLGIGFGLGLVLALVLLGGLAVPGIWRVVVLPVALVLVVRALAGLVAIGRAEWRRERVGIRGYGLVVLRFGIAYLLVAAASS
jgi:hypothetical protein